MLHGMGGKSRVVVWVRVQHPSTKKETPFGAVEKMDERARGRLYVVYEDNSMNACVVYVVNVVLIAGIKHKCVWEQLFSATERVTCSTRLPMTNLSQPRRP